MDTLVEQIFSTLSDYFPPNPSEANAYNQEGALRALRLITRLKEPSVAAESYKLFGKIMQSNAAGAKYMEAAWLALHPFYQQEPNPPAMHPEYIRNLVQYYTNLRTEKDHATPATPTANPAHNNPTGSIRNVDQLPDQDELEWWEGLLSGVKDDGGGGGRGRPEAAQNSNQEGEGGARSSASPPAL